MNRLVCLPLLCLLALSARTVEPSDVKSLLDREIVGPRQARLDVSEYLRGHIPKVRPAKTADEWAKESERLRREIVKRIMNVSAFGKRKCRLGLTADMS